MNNKSLQNFFVVALAVLISFNSLMPTVKAQEPARSPLVITEIVPDTDNVSGSDAYEFFEIKNISNQTIDTNDYIIYYNNKDIWQLDDQITLDPQEVLVVWIINEKNTALTADDFNSYWGSELVQGDNLTTVRSGGFANGSQRDLEIYTNTWELLNLARYNHGDVKSVVKDGGIKYNYTGATVSEIISYDTKGSAGVVEEDQIATANYEFKGVSSSLNVEANELVKFNTDWQYQILLDPETLIVDANLTLTDESHETLTYPMILTDNKLTVQIPFQDLVSFDKFTAQAEVFDGITRTSTSPMIVEVEKGELDKTNIPTLIITELIPDTSNANGADAYEFIEVTNNSDRQINFKDYQLLYNYPDNGPDSNVLWFQTREDLFVEPNASLVFWVKNGKNDHLTVEDFNNHFNSNLILNENIFEIFNAGMSNSGPRGMYVKSNVGDTYSYVQYNMNGKEVTADRSIAYRYNTTTETVELITNNALPTPGFVPEELANVNAAYTAPVSEISIRDNTAETFDSEQGLKFEIEVLSNSQEIKTVELYIKENTSNEYDTVMLERSPDNPAIFSHRVDPVDLPGKEYFDYYFVLSDGTQELKVTTKRIDSINEDTGDIKFNLESGTYVNDSVFVSTNGNSLSLNGEDLTPKTQKSLDSKAKFVFDTSQTDAFFKNAVAIGTDVIGVFDEGTYSNWRTYTFDVPLEAIRPGEVLQIDIHAGNKANVLEHNEENNDDFTVKNIRLVLPNGYTLRPEGFEDPNNNILMGDSSGKIEILEAKFTIEDHMYNAIGTLVDTTKLEDGTYELLASKEDSEEQASINLIIDNSGPEVTVSIEDKEMIRGERQLTVNLKDRGIGVDEDETKLYLDDKLIELPLTFDSSKDEAKTYALKIIAKDKLANKTVKEINFTIPDEHPVIRDVSAKVSDGKIEFSVDAEDKQDDTMKAQIKLSQNFNLDSPEISVEKGRSDRSASANDVFAEDSINGFPYEVYTLKVGKNLREDDKLRINWVGETNNSKTFLYALNSETNAWDKLDTKMSKRSEGTPARSEVKLEATVYTNKYLNSDNELKVMVQNGEGFIPQQFEAGASATQPEFSHITTSHPDDTPRSNYDFTFAWESDTQYYNEEYEGNPNIVGKYQYQLDIHDWLIANRPRLNLQYLFHTGDIVDDADEVEQWDNADKAYQMLDDAGLPYGVLAGNHDVSQLSSDYTMYGNYFGDFRFQDREYFGESYKNNRGHYDLITVGGIDFIMVYMGWDIDEAEINWINNVLAQYPERIAILSFHEYLLASGGLGEQPQAIYNQIVSQNHNVKMVLSGHYHNAVTVPVEFDDDGDGVIDRTVYQMLFDYQGLKEGGMGYLRLLHFDNKTEEIIVRTYSPSLDDYDAKDYPGIGAEGIKGDENFRIPYADVNIIPERKLIATNSLNMSIDSNVVVAEIAEIKSGETAAVKVDVPEGAETISWFLELTDPYGGVAKSPVYVTDVEIGTMDPSRESSTVDKEDDTEFSQKDDKEATYVPRSDNLDVENPVLRDLRTEQAGMEDPEQKEKFELVFKLNGGTWSDGSTADVVMEVEKSSVIEIPEAPIREGYTFEYWKGSEYRPGDKYTVVGDHIFVAQWKKNTAQIPENTVSSSEVAGKKDTSVPAKTGQSEQLMFVGIASLLVTGLVITKRKKI